MTESIRFEKRVKADEVLSVYQRISPSALPIEDRAMYRKVEARLESILCRRLKFPKRFFRDLNYINFGCGTGESDMVLASWGASGLGIDFNPISIDRANSLKQRFGLEQRLHFQVGDILKPQVEGKSFELVFSDGVLPHVENHEMMLTQMASLVQPDGYLILGYLDQAGNVQRLLHGVVSHLLASNRSMDEVERIAYSLFKEHLDRCSRFGGRTVAAVINDYIHNKHSYGVDTCRIVKLLSNLGLELHTSYPLNPTLVNENPSDQPSKHWDRNLAFWRLQQISWMFSDQYDEWALGHEGERTLETLFDRLDSIILGETPTDAVRSAISELKRFVGDAEKEISKRISTNISAGLDELETFLQLLDGKSLGTLGPQAISKFQRMFRGFNGFGTCYMAFRKTPPAALD